MAEKRIMLLGANGQVGQAVRAECMPSEWRIGAYAHADLDITQHHLVQSAIREFRPDIIINSAAMTGVDDAQQNPDLAMAINFEAVANIAAQASALDIPVIHLSTDYVFDGEDGRLPYRPEDRMHPLNTYGESKMMGEEALRHGHSWSVVLRISSVFSAYGNNLLTAMLKMIDERDEIMGFTDMETGPTPATDVAKALVTMTGAIFGGKHDGFGVFHLCGSPSATRYEFAKAIMEAYAPYTSRRPNIIPAQSSELMARAPRPSWTVFDCAKIEKVYGVKQRAWREGLAEAMATLMSDRRKIA